MSGPQIRRGHPTTQNGVLGISFWPPSRSHLLPTQVPGLALNSQQPLPGEELARLPEDRALGHRSALADSGHPDFLGIPLLCLPPSGQGRIKLTINSADLSQQEEPRPSPAGRQGWAGEEPERQSTALPTPSAISSKGVGAPVFLPGESQGRGSLMGCCLWGRTEYRSPNTHSCAHILVPALS